MTARIYAVVILIILAVVIGIAALSQFSVPTLFDADGYYHIRVASFIPQFGLSSLKHNFHWAKYSVFAQHFSDKDFLFHLFLIPFTWLPNMLLGAKIAAVVSAGFFLGVYALMLYRYAPRWAAPWLMLAPILSSAFLHGLCRTRPMVLVFAFTFLCLHAVIHRRWIAAGVWACVYTLCHVSSPVLLIFVLLCEVIRYLSEKQWCWKTVAAIVAGLAAGFLLHPHFPHNLRIFYINGVMVPVFALKWGIELGAEFFPLDTREYLLSYPLAAVAILAIVVFAYSRTVRASFATKCWSVCAGCFLLFSFFSQRYMLHGYPLMLVAVASYARDWSLSPGDSIKRWMKLSAMAITVVLVCALSVLTFSRFKKIALSEMVYNKHYETVGVWMDQNIPAGELIFHTNWSDSQYFIGLNPKDDYFVTLDPTYMYYWNRDLYNLYRSVSFGSEADPYSVLKNTFKVRYGYAGKQFFNRFVEQVKADARFRVLAENDFGLIFTLQ